MSIYHTPRGISALSARLGALAPRHLGMFACAGLAVALAGYGGSFERRWLSVTHHQVTLDDLPTAWDGLRLVQLSDFHLGARGTPTRMLEHAIETTTALHPDLILLTGDYSDDGRPRDLTLLGPLAGIAPTFAVLGNHDYFRGRVSADRIASLLESHGITVLRNAMAAFVLHGVAGTIAGFDQGGGSADPAVARLLLRLAEHRPQIALIHEPDIVDRFPTRSVGVTLAGHTHGAQIRLSPLRRIDWIRWSPTDNRSRFPRGWFTAKGNRLYVSRGLGVSWLPVRFAARPELVCVTLRAAISNQGSPDQRAVDDGQTASLDSAVVDSLVPRTERSGIAAQDAQRRSYLI